MCSRRGVNKRNISQWFSARKYAPTHKSVYIGLHIYICSLYLFKCPFNTLRTAYVCTDEIVMKH